MARRNSFREGQRALDLALAHFKVVAAIDIQCPECESGAWLADMGRLESLTSGLKAEAWMAGRMAPRDGRWFMGLVRLDDGGIFRTRSRFDLRDSYWLDDEGNELQTLRGWRPEC